MSRKSLQNLLNPNSGGELGDIVRRAKAMGELTEAITGALPDEFAGSVLAASLREGGELVVLAASPAWAAKLRFEADRMVAIARDSGADVQSCRVRVSRMDTSG